MMGLGFGVKDIEQYQKSDVRRAEMEVTGRKMTCHNCLEEIDPQTEGYRRIRGTEEHGRSKTLFIHWPKCPEGANPLAHFQKLSREK